MPKAPIVLQYKIHLHSLTSLTLSTFGLFTMTSPFLIGHNNGAQIPASAQHGTAEHWSGTVFSSDIGGRFGITPPTSQRRRSRSPRTGPRGNYAPRPNRDEDEDERERERDVRRRPPHERAEQPLPEGWGGRMLQAENKIR